MKGSVVPDTKWLLPPRLHQQDSLIAAYNEKFDRELRAWVASHSGFLDGVRTRLSKAG